MYFSFCIKRQRNAVENYLAGSDLLNLKKNIQDFQYAYLLSIKAGTVEGRGGTEKRQAPLLPFCKGVLGPKCPFISLSAKYQ